jgi:hypothetical protein
MSVSVIEPCIYRLKCGDFYVKIYRRGLNLSGGTHHDLAAAREARDFLQCAHPPGRPGRRRKCLASNDDTLTA